MIAVENLVATADIALLQGLDRLQRSCVALWSTLQDAEKSRLVSEGKMPQAVQQLFGVSGAGDPNQQEKKKRRTF